MAYGVTYSGALGALVESLDDLSVRYACIWDPKDEWYEVLFPCSDSDGFVRQRFTEGGELIDTIHFREAPELVYHDA